MSNCSACGLNCGDTCYRPRPQKRKEKTFTPSEVQALQNQVDDLAMLVKRLVQSNRKYVPSSVITQDAMSYLHRHDLLGNKIKVEE